MTLKSIPKAAKFAKSAGTSEKEMLMHLHQNFIDLINKGIDSEKEMRISSQRTQQEMLLQSLKAAETVDAENFGVLVSALKEVSLASIEAQKAISLANADNGRAFIKVLDNAVQAGVQMMGLKAASLREAAELVDDSFEDEDDWSPRMKRA